MSKDDDLFPQYALCVWRLVRKNSFYVDANGNEKPYRVDEYAENDSDAIIETLRRYKLWQSISGNGVDLIFSIEKLSESRGFPSYNDIISLTPRAISFYSGQPPSILVEHFTEITRAPHSRLVKFIGRQNTFMF